MSHPISHRRTMSRKVCFVAVFAVFALLQVCLLLCLRITSMLELIFSQIPPHTYKVLRFRPLLCTKIYHKKMRPFRAEFFYFKMLTHKIGLGPVLYMCVSSGENVSDRFDNRFAYTNTCNSSPRLSLMFSLP